MENPSQIIKNFEQILKKQCTKKISVLYKDIRHSNRISTCRPQDVISGVSNQLKAIQSADCLKGGKSVNLNDYQTSCFLSVDKLAMNEASNKQNVNNFETQCVSDTQLIDILTDAEALLDTHKGMTQEFETSFSHIQIEKFKQYNVKNLDVQEKSTSIDVKKEEYLEYKNNFILKDMNEFEAHSKAPLQSNKIDLVKKSCKTYTREAKCKDFKCFAAENKCIANENIQISEKNNIDKSDTLINTHSIPMNEINDITLFNESLEIYDKDTKAVVNNDMLLSRNIIRTSKSIIIHESNELKKDTCRSPSPVFNMKVANKANTPSPLVFNLDTFEKFEQIATPLIKDNLDLKMVKHLINSQILGNELCLHTETYAINDRSLSPILKKGDENIKFDKTIADINNGNENKQKYIFGHKPRKHNNSLQDEILFSSDEEYDYIHRESQNLPFTCALETSICENSNVFDKMMYVGFQTASNKSIQVLTESLVKAKSILSDSDDNITNKELTLSDMVQICDCTSKNVINKNCINIDDNSKNSDVEVTKDNIILDIENNIESNKNEIALVQVNNTHFTESREVHEQPIFKGFMKVNDKKRKLENEECFTESLKNYNKIVLEETLVEANINDKMTTQEFENTEEHKKLNRLIFTGFKTASKKEINVSNDTLEKTKQIFKNMDMHEFNDPVQILPLSPNKAINNIGYKPKNIIEPINNSFIGFKTASNKKINIANSALDKTKNIFQDFDFSDCGMPNHIEIDPKKKEKIDIIDDFNNHLTSKLLIGFKTANNKDIIISDDALLKSKKTFEGIDHLTIDKKESIHRFVAASKNEVNISPEALESKNKELYANKIIKKFKDAKKIYRPISSLFGFQANNKSMGISEEALTESKNILQTLDKTYIDNKKLPSNYDCLEDEVTPVIKGFLTASNKTVTISDIAFAKSKKQFENLASIDPVKINNEKNITENVEIPVYKGFQTASNKNMSISDQALSNSKKLFQDLEFSGSLGNKMDCNKNNNTKTSVFKGFQTASHKKVTITKEALAKSKDLFKDLHLLDYSNDIEIEGPIVSGESHTASNKKQKISTETLPKTKYIFQDINDFKTSSNYSNNNEEIKSPTIDKEDLFSDKIENDNFISGTKTIVNTLFKGFQTASNKTVQVSEHALAKSKKIFNDIDLTSQSHKLKDRKTNLEIDIKKDGKKENTKSNDFISTTCGFKTAGNNIIKISDDAMKKTNKIFENLYSEYPVGTNIIRETTNSCHDNVSIDNIINTQVINNFEETLCTEDFHNVTPQTKRSGSPILSCPKAKRRKFETPYKNTQIQINTSNDIVEIKRNTTIMLNDNYKKNKKYTLKDLQNVVDNDDNNNIIDSYILNFNFDNLLHFEFFDKRNDLTNNKINIEDLKQLFIESVNEKLIPDGWLHNHLQLILWKLISYEIKFPKCMKLVCTARNTLNQLKYRYDRELYNAERPALRKILEKDDVALKTIILCVIGVYADGIKVNRATSTSNLELMLTDGWYSIKASIDKMLAKLVCDEKICVGTKIVTNGAELVNCEQGVAPWEDTSSIRLKLFGNSTRRARWDARLGYHGNAAILTHLSNVKTDGGKISKLRLFVTRVYPALYVEKFEDGSTVTRSERLEHQHQTKYEAERQVLLEILYEEVEKEFSDWDDQDSEGIADLSNKRKCLDSGSQIAKIMKGSHDPVEFRSKLTDSQVKLLEEHTTKRRERLLQNIQTNLLEKMKKQGLCQGRNVIILLKIRVAGFEERNGDIIVTKGMLSLWKPTDDVQELIREGAWIEVMNVVPTAMRYSEIQISAGRQSVFSLSKYKECDKIKMHMQSLGRKCYPIKDLIKNSSATTDNNEIDTVGFVFLIDPSSRNFDSNKNQFQNVYIADANKNMICINFWGGLKKFGFAIILDTGQIFACMNLQKRVGNTRKNIPQYRVTEFSYFTKSPKNIHIQEMVEEINKKLTDRRKFCDDCVNLKNNFTVRLQQNNENITPYRINNIDLAKNKMFIDTPFSVKCNKKDDFNLTGLDFESTFKQTDTGELSPKSFLRKRKVNEKIEKLKMYGEPPPIAPIHIINKTENALNSYKSPLMSKNDVTNKVATPKQIPDSCAKINVRETAPCSPVTSVNRTYIKSNVNPVRLNFDHVDNNLSENVDHFAEEFDESPPLSLD